MQIIFQKVWSIKITDVLLLNFNLFTMLEEQVIYLDAIQTKITEILKKYFLENVDLDILLCTLQSNQSLYHFSCIYRVERTFHNLDYYNVCFPWSIICLQYNLSVIIRVLSGFAVGCVMCKSMWKYEINLYLKLSSLERPLIPLLACRESSTSVWRKWWTVNIKLPKYKYNYPKHKLFKPSSKTIIPLLILNNCFINNDNLLQ